MKQCPVITTITGHLLLPPGSVHVAISGHVGDAARRSPGAHVAADRVATARQAIRAAGRVGVTPTAEEAGSAAARAISIAADRLRVHLEVGLAIRAERSTLLGISIPVFGARSGWIVVRAAVPACWAVANGEVTRWVAGKMARLVSQALAAPARAANVAPATAVRISLADALAFIGADAAAVTTNQVIV